jgi:hypothetical protein
MHKANTHYEELKAYCILNVILQRKMQYQTGSAHTNKAESKNLYWSEDI